MRFLERVELILRHINLYDDPPLKIASFEIPFLVGPLFVAFSLLVTYIPSVAKCITDVTDFLSLLPAILVISANISITSTYVSCLCNRRSIIDSINHLEDYVNQSEC